MAAIPMYMYVMLAAILLTAMSVFTFSYYGLENITYITIAVTIGAFALFLYLLSKGE